MSAGAWRGSGTRRGWRDDVHSPTRQLGRGCVWVTSPPGASSLNGLPRSALYSLTAHHKEPTRPLKPLGFT